LGLALHIFDRRFEIVIRNRRLPSVCRHGALAFDDRNDKDIFALLDLRLAGRFVAELRFQNVWQPPQLAV
jgi:hypothetical protein